ncbi:MAG: hypothetical protein KBH09_11860 [Saprospiraceae bacterium]|nr:hypothetical protein [Saprospiraceae bacterium]
MSRWLYTGITTGRSISFCCTRCAGRYDSNTSRYDGGTSSRRGRRGNDD